MIPWISLRLAAPPTRRNRALHQIALGLACAAAVHAQPPQMAREEEPHETTFTLVRADPFPRPDGLVPVPLDNAGFEAPLRATGGIRTVRLERVEAATAPEGRAFLRAAGDSPAQVSLEVPASEARPYVVSFWLRSNARGTGTATSVTNATYFGKVTPLTLPNTAGAWRRVGLFFRTAPGTTAVQLLLRFAPAAPSEFDDLQVREASEAEFAAAYAAWRSRYPARDLAPRPDDGRHLALFVSKLTTPDAPRRPLRVMGIGSSYTNMLGNGETLIQHIREKFPQAPPILYTKHVGSAVEFDFTRGWMRQHVLGERPDLVILYSGGKAADLEKLLADFRAHSSADVIVASLHLRAADKAVTDASVNAPEWDAIRAVAEKYGCEWVDNRREWARYLQDHGRPIEWLLKDAVHQSDHGALVINENICRHLTRHPAPAYAPATRERRLALASTTQGPRTGEAVTLDAAWERRPDGAARATRSGARARVRFHGHRLDVIVEASPRGSRASVTIDGRPGAEYPAFVTTLIIPGPKNFKPQRGLAADRAPHQIQLGDPTRIVPQAWTLRMTSDTGDYELIGSTTGLAGRGNNGTDYTSELAQITVPPALWRRRLEADGTHANRTGDTFTWEVRRATLPEINLPVSGRDSAAVELTVADNLSPGWHEVEFVSADRGELILQGVVVYEPAITAPR